MCVCVTNLRFSFLRFYSETEVKDVCLCVSNSSLVTAYDGSEDFMLQNERMEIQPNQIHLNQNQWHHTTPAVTNEEYSDSSGVLYNDYLSNNNVSVKKIVNNIYTTRGCP